MILEEIVEVLKIKEEDTIKGALVKGLAQGALVGLMYVGALRITDDIVGKLKK